MGEQSVNTSAPQPKVRKSFLVVVLLIGLPWLFLVAIGLWILAEVPLRLAAGWVLFLNRVIPQVTVDPAGLGLGALALVGFWIGLHITGRKVRSSFADPDRPLVWRWRWTNSIVICLLLAFAAGTACVGLAHQLVWMSSEKLVDQPQIAVRVHSKNKLKILGLSAHNYHDEYQVFPAGGTFSPSGQAMHSWQTHLLPYMERTQLFETIMLEKPWRDAVNRPAFEQRLDEFEIDSDSSDFVDGLAPSSYASNALVMGGGAALARKDIGDGTSNTLLTGEVNSNHRAWGDPRNWRDPRIGLNKHPDGFGSPFNNGVQFGMADGSVRFISEKIDPDVLKAIATPNGSESIDEY